MSVRVSRAAIKRNKGKVKHVKQNQQTPWGLYPRGNHDRSNIADWTNYLKKNSTLYVTGKDLFGNTYGNQTVDSLPKVPANAWATLSDVADATFWSPYDHN